MSASGIFPTDEWTFGTGKVEAGPIFVRFRSGLPSDADVALFSTLVIIKWPFAPNELGLPDTEVLEAMGEFEETVLEASDEDKFWGTCVSIFTEPGFREWRFYTPDATQFSDQFSQALSGLGPYPLDIQAFDDPEWGGFHEIRDMMSPE